MKYPYRVIKNGIWYMAGEEVPDDDEKTVVEEVKEEVNEVVDEPEIEVEKPVPVVEEKKEFVPTPKYGKNQINRMPISDLRNVAVEVGIKDIQSKTGAELKREIIEILGL